MKKTRYLMLLMLWFILNSTSAQPSLFKVGPNIYAAGILTNEFDMKTVYRLYPYQKMENWCWAACIETVLNFHGVNISQEQVVNYIYGDLIDRPGNIQQILGALNGWKMNIYGRPAFVHSEPMYLVNDVTNHLTNKRPIIVGLSNPGVSIGHAYVLTAIYFTTDMYNNTVPLKVVLRDPYPHYLKDGMYRSPRTEMSWHEFNTRFMLAVKTWVQFY